MGLITLAMAKKYSNSKGGYVEPGKVYTFDGNAEETENYNGIIYAKIASTAPNLHNVTKAVYTAPDGSTVEILAENMNVEDIYGGQRIIASMMGQNISVIVLDDAGLWGYAQPGYGYCSLIEFAETIHPIDPKYLPGVCLPVVEIGDMDAITASESVAFTAAAENGLPCVVKWFSEDGTGMSTVLNLYVIDGVRQYSAFTQDAPLTIVKDSESGLWKLAG